MVPRYNDSIHSSLEGPEGGNGQPSSRVLLSAGIEGTAFIHSHDMRMFSKGNKKNLCQEVTDDTQVSIFSSRDTVRIISDAVEYLQDIESRIPAQVTCHSGPQKERPFGGRKHHLSADRFNYGLKEREVIQE